MAHRYIVAAYWFGSYRSKSRHRETSGLGWLGQYLKSRVARRLLEHSALFRMVVPWCFDHLRHSVIAAVRAGRPLAGTCCEPAHNRTGKGCHHFEF